MKTKKVLLICIIGILLVSGCTDTGITGTDQPEILSPPEDQSNLLPEDGHDKVSPPHIERPAQTDQPREKTGEFHGPSPEFNVSMVDSDYGIAPGNLSRILPGSNIK